MYRIYGKRLFDLALVIPTLAVLSPILGVLALLVCIESEGPVFYVQDRLGKNGKVFKLIKFRSMIHREDRKPGEAGELVNNNHPEITKIGKIIRRFKIDELPQLFNILKG